MRKIMTLTLTLGLILTANAQIKEFQITTNKFDQDAPAIYKNIVVWRDERNGTWDIYGYDLSTKNEFRITTYKSWKSAPDIYGDIIVWMDKRNRNWDIYGYNLSTEEEFRITTNSARQYSPAIYGNIVVWEDLRNGSWNTDIYGYDLSTKEEFQITTDTSKQGSPSIYGNIVVWTDERNGNKDIYGYDLSTKKELQITTDISIQYWHDIYKNIVVWTDKRNGNYDIYSYDLSTKREFRITTNSSSQYGPVIYENIVVWNDFRNWPDYPENANLDIYGYDLSTGVEFPIVTKKSNQQLPAIYKNIVVWIDQRNGNDDIYGAYVTPPDHQGPITLNTSVTPNPTNCVTKVTLTAIIDDSTTGNSKINAAEYFIDYVGINGTGTAMSTIDGAFDEVNESVRANVDVSGLSAGTHRIYVDGKDSANNWGVKSYVLIVISDCKGPMATSVLANPNPTACTNNITLTATINDWKTGNSKINAAEYFIDIVGENGTGTAMSALDGAFDELSEDVTVSVDVSGLSAGNHKIYVHGWDALGNWGAFQSFTLTVSCQKDERKAQIPAFALILPIIWYAMKKAQKYRRNETRR